MKLFFRIFIITNCILLVGLVVAYLVLTRPGVQKKIIESQLPEGSSIGFVHLTSGRVAVESLNLRLADGTTAVVDGFNSEFSLLAALMDQTIRLRGLSVEGLVVTLPKVDTVSAVEGEVTQAVDSDGSSTAVKSEAPAVKSAKPAEGPSPADVLFALGEFEWLIDIDSISIEGALIDGASNRYGFTIASDRLAPGATTELTADLKLESQATLQGGLSDFSSDLQVQLVQGATGGFEQMKLISTSEGMDASGSSLLALSQTLDLSANSTDKSAAVNFTFDLAMPQPEIFVPQLSAVEKLRVTSQGSARADGDVLTLETAEFGVMSDDLEVISAILKQRMTLGGEQKFIGNLMEVRVSNLPLAWVNPWLGQGMLLSGAPFSAQIAVVGQADGTLKVETLAPIEWGPISFSNGGSALIDQITLRANPTLWIEDGEVIRYDLGELVLSNSDRRFLGGEVSGLQRLTPQADGKNGMQMNARLSLALAELFRQPVLASFASVMAGQMDVQIEIDDTQKHLLQLQSAITGLRARAVSMDVQDYRLAAQVGQAMGGSLNVEMNFEAGPENRPSTSLQIAGQVNPNKMPLPFSMNITGQRVTQRDLDLIVAVAQPKESEPSGQPMPPTSPNRPSSPSAPPASSPMPPVAPAWASLDGQVSIDLDELALNSGMRVKDVTARATISEPKLSIRDLSAALNQGRVQGEAEVTFNPDRASAYALQSNLRFEQIDPSYFAKGPSDSFPVQGLFDGRFTASGSGGSLEQAIENGEVDLLLTGKNGLFTAFKLDNVSQLGLIGAGLLGQGLKRPGISALAQAVPYFENIRFSEFVLELTRQQDKKVRIPQLSLIGENLRIEGSGLIAASRLRDVLDQPLNLSLGFGAKGGLVQHLETLGLLRSDSGASGFQNWNQEINIGGTLGRPNTDALKDLLRGAAMRALNQPEGSLLNRATQGGASDGAPVPQESKTKEQKILEDVGRGFNALNSLIN